MNTNNFKLFRDSMQKNNSTPSQNMTNTTPVNFDSISKEISDIFKLLPSLQPRITLEQRFSEEGQTDEFNKKSVTYGEIISKLTGISTLIDELKQSQLSPNEISDKYKSISKEISDIFKLLPSLQPRITLEQRFSEEGQTDEFNKESVIYGEIISKLTGISTSIEKLNPSQSTPKKELPDDLLK